MALRLGMPSWPELTSHDWLRDRSCLEFGVLWLDVGVANG
jgi:hypothetical protein